MKPLKFSLVLIIAFSISNIYAQKEHTVGSFDKIIVSPYIEVKLVQGNEENVIVENITVDESKLNIEVHGKTLRVYLDDAKDIPKQKKVDVEGYKTKHPIYHGTVVSVTIHFKNIEELSFRGEEQLICETIKADKFNLTIYGESRLIFNEMEFNKLNTVIYGESELTFASGSVTDQKFTAYGESIVDANEIKNETTKIVAYGESKFKINCSDELKITSYGEPWIEYSGNPIIKKGINIGDSKITSMDN